MVVLSAGTMVAAAFLLYVCCPRSRTFGGRRHAPLAVVGGGGAVSPNGGATTTAEDGYFRTPLVPFWPLLGIFTNWYLIAQLDFLGVASMMGCLLLATVYYFAFVLHTSVGNTTGWVVEDHPAAGGPIEMTRQRPRKTEHLSDDDEEEHHDEPFSTRRSLPGFT